MNSSPGLGKARMGAAHRATISLSKAACTSEIHWKDRLFSASFVSGFAMSAKLEINRL
jgi:hypothetical protein